MPSGAGWLRRGLVALCLAASLVTMSFGLLFAADYNLARVPTVAPRPRAEWVWARGDHVHYAIHLTLGRLLDVCPCTRRAAATQYVKARFHAITGRQRAVVANVHPRSAGEWLGYAVGPVGVGIDWLGDALTWLSGDRSELELWRW